MATPRLKAYALEEAGIRTFITGYDSAVSAGAIQRSSKAFNITLKALAGKPFIFTGDVIELFLDVRKVPVV